MGRLQDCYGSVTGVLQECFGSATDGSPTAVLGECCGTSAGVLRECCGSARGVGGALIVVICVLEANPRQVDGQIDGRAASRRKAFAQSVINGLCVINPWTHGLLDGFT